MLGKNLIASLLTQIPVFILGVLAGIFSTRFLGDDAKGIYSIFQANTQLFVLIFSLGMQTGIVYFISSKNISENRVLGICNQLLFIGSVIFLMLLVLLYMSNSLEYLTAAQYSSFKYVVILFLLFIFSISGTIISAFFQAYSKFKIINLVSLINSVSNFLIFLGLFIFIEHTVLNQSEKINYALYLTILSYILNTLIWLIYFYKELNIKPNYEFSLNKEFKTFVYYSLIIFAGTLINFFNYRIDLWIVNYYLSDESLSYYSLASNIAQIIIYTSVTIGTVILPYLSSKNIEERKSMFPKITRYSFSFFVIVIVIAYIISEYIIPLVYGKAFYDAVKPFKILLPGVLFSCQTQLIATLIVASKKNTLNIIATGTGLIFTIALDLYLIPLWGIEGAAWATTISYMIIFTITYYLFLKYLKYPFVNYFFVNWQDINSIIKFFRK